MTSKGMGGKPGQEKEKEGESNGKEKNNSGEYTGRKGKVNEGWETIATDRQKVAIKDLNRSSLIKGVIFKIKGL